MSYDENRISDQIDGGIEQQKAEWDKKDKEMKDLKEQHFKTIISTYNSITDHIDTEEAAEQCAEISKKHGEIRYLEGIIDGIKYPYEEVLDKLKILEQELEELKND